MKKEPKLIVVPNNKSGYFVIRNIWFVFILMIMIVGATMARVSMQEIIPSASDMLNKIINMAIIGACIATFVIYAYKVVMLHLHTIKIRYIFYDDYVEFQDEFLNQNIKEILYENITEVSITQTVWDRILGVGTISLKTPVEYNNGIHMPHIENPREIAKVMREIANAN